MKKKEVLYDLEKFMSKAEDNYEIAVTDMLYKMPGLTPLELILNRNILKG